MNDSVEYEIRDECAAQIARLGNGIAIQAAVPESCITKGFAWKLLCLDKTICWMLSYLAMADLAKRKVSGLKLVPVKFGQKGAWGRKCSWNPSFSTVSAVEKEGNIA